MASLATNAQDISGIWQGSRGENNPINGSPFNVDYAFRFTSQGDYQQAAAIDGTIVLNVTGRYTLTRATKSNDPFVTNLLTLQPVSIITNPSQNDLVLFAAASLPNVKPTQQWVGFFTLDAAPAMTLQDVTSPDTWELRKTSNIPPAATGSQFVPILPCRVSDTRWSVGALGGPEMGGGTVRTFAVTNSTCGIPATASAYSLNVTAVPDGGLGYLTLWPAGQTRPTVSTLNSDGRVKANAAIVPAGAGGGVSVFVTDASHVILDIDGYFVPAGTASALSFYPLTPCRVVDTRNPAGGLGGPALSGGHARLFPIQSSACNIPSSAQAYSLNFTAVPHSGLSYLSVWPTGRSQPFVSTLNASKPTVTANAAIVEAGTGGAISVFASDDTDLVVDINGYFAPPTSGGLLLYPTTPCRVLDSRLLGAQGSFSGARSVNFATSSCAPPATARGYIVNATVIPAAGLGYLSIWPDGVNQPVVSTLNSFDGAVASNMAIVPTNNGVIDVFASNPTYLVLDIFGYFAL